MSPPTGSPRSTRATFPRSVTPPSSEPKAPPTTRSTARPSPAETQRATASGSTRLAQIAVARPGTLARQENGYADPRSERTRPIFHRPDEIRDRSRLRERRILVRRHAVRGREIEGRDEGTRHVPMRIHRGGNERAGPDQTPNGTREVAFRVGHADDAHGAVDVEENSGDRHGVAKPFEKLRLDGLVEAALHRAARESSRVHEWRPLDVGGQMLVPRK